MLNHILYFLSGFLKCKIIKGDDKQPYLERYMLKRWGKNGEHTLFLHRFLDSDSDRGIHNHPWNSWSYILAGGYFERRMIEKNGNKQVIVRDIKPLTINKIRKDDLHQIILKEKTPAWTIFYHGPRVQHWGFQDYSYKQEGNHDVEIGDFHPYQDKTDPTEKWETKALKGKNSPREAVDYIYKK